MSDLPEGHFADFVSSRLPALYRYGYVLTGDQHDAEELVQEALTRTGASWHRVRNQHDPEGYVRQTMVRLMCNRWRRPIRERLVARPPEVAVLDRGLELVESRQSLEELLDALPARQRAVLVLRYVEDLSEQQIADVMQCSPGTVKSQASKALAALRRATDEDKQREGADGRP